MKTYVLLLVSVFLIFSCRNMTNESSSIRTIELIPPIEKSICERNISYFSRQIGYVPLQRTEECNISIIKKAIFTKTEILINNANRDLLCFSIDGSFKRPIGHYGKGPGEFSNILDFSVDKISGNIFILTSPNKIQVFTKNGNYIKSVKIHGEQAATIESVNNDILIHYNNYAGNNPTRFRIYDINGKLKKKFSNSYQFKINGGILTMDHECDFFKFNNRVRFKELHSDTVFSFKNTEFIPFVILHTGKYGLSPKIRGSKDYYGNSSRYVHFSRLFESGKSLYAIFSHEGNELMVVLNKSTNKSELIQIKTLLPNDVDGGVNNYPLNSVEIKKVNYFVNFVLPYQLKEHVASEAFKNSTPKYPEKKKELEALANSLSENDNPVLMLVKLKQ